MLNDLIKKEKENIWKNKDINLEEEYNFVSKNIKHFEDISNELLKNQKKIFKKNNYTYLAISEKFNDQLIIYKYISIFIIKSFNYDYGEYNKIEKEITIYELSKNVQKYLNNLIIIINHNNKKKIILKESNDQKIIFKIINLLIDSELLKSKNIMVNKKSSIIVWLKNFDNTFKLKIYKDKFTTINQNNVQYLLNNHYLDLIKITTPNIKSNKEFIFSKFSKKIINKLLNLELKIDTNICSEISKEYDNEYSITSDPLIEHDEIMEKISKIKYMNYEKKELINRLQILKKSIILRKISLLENKTYYLPYMVDFRGRIYFLSNISPTFVKEMRYAVYFGEYETKWLKEYKFNRTDKIIIRYADIIDSIISTKNDIVKVAIIWHLISIGSCFKKEIGKEMKIEKLIEKGIEIFKKNKYEQLEYEDKIKIKFSIYFIKELIQGINIKRPISKDATASVYQHLVKVLGGKDDWSYKITNLNSEDTAYDTYSYIIEDWLKKSNINKEEIENFDKIFNRSNLKKTIMTENYGCGIWTAKNYFIEKIGEEYRNNIKIIKIFESFYQYLSKSENITKESSKNIIDHFTKLEFGDQLLIDESKVNFSYYRQKTKRLNTTVNTKRYTHNLSEITEILDRNKSQRSVRANFIHSCDAHIVREVINSEKIDQTIPIHDCFIIDQFNTSTLIEELNRAMNI